MARGYRSRRYKPMRRIGRRFKKSSSLKKIKKDILKCNFPTKVKFMGLTEKKVMFLTKTFDFKFNSDATADVQTPVGHSFILNPLDTDNIESIMGIKNLTKVGDNTVKAMFSNWDKFCILGVYIKFQPQQNMWEANSLNKNTINTVKCIYTSNNCPLKATVFDQPTEIANLYDKENLKNKQVFTFNSNEAFTIYVPAPTTMESTSAVVHKAKTWWSLTDLKKPDADSTRSLGMDEEESNEDESVNDEQVMFSDLGTPITTPATDKPDFSAGRIYLESIGARYNITINYKVALKG